ncbi:MAG: carboxypeptidase-like regulatory domain-containing protein [Candidatus Solibacter sp.]
MKLTLLFNERVFSPMRGNLVALLAISTLDAQTTLGVGSLRGTIVDGSDRPVPGARVTLTEPSKGLIRNSESGADGSFLFASVLAGAYSVRLEMAGFITRQIEGLKIDIGQEASVNVRLELGEVRTSVTVRAPGATQLSAQSSANGTVVDSIRVRELPLNGRNFLDLALLSGGTNEVSGASDIFTTNVGPPGRLVVLPGTFPYAGSYSLNGFNIRGSRDGELALSPSIAAIDQFKVQEGFLAPEEGTGSAVVNIVTKSGSNQFHGEAFEFFRNEVLDARSFFAPTREDLKRNQFGGAAGGPLRKDRAWFHAFYEGLRELTAFSAAGYSPTEEMFRGNFIATGRMIYDPASFRPESGSREPFPNFTIPANRMNPVARNLLAYYRSGTSLSARPNNVFANPRNTLNDDQGGARVDVALTTRSQLFGQFFHQNEPSVRRGLFPLTGLLYQNESTLAMVQHAWSLSPTLVNSLRFGFLRNVAVGGNEAGGLGPILDQIGITNTFDSRGVTAVNLQGYSPFGRANGEVGNRDNTWQLDEELTYNTATHNLAAGVGTRYRRGWHLNGNSSAIGTLSFQPVFTAQLAANAQGQLAPAAGTGDAFADFLLGLPVTGLLTGLPRVQFRATQVTPFVQDSWRLTRNLTLNYGVSWFFETPPDAQGKSRDLVHSFDPRTGLVTYSGLGQIGPDTMAPDKNNFAPRLGLAWNPSFSSSTVIRIGAGIYYSEFPWLFAPYPFASPSPAGVGKSFANSLTNPVPTYALGVNIFPPSASAALTSSYAASLPQGTVVTLLNHDYRTTYASQWTVSIQHKATRNDFVELSYRGSSSHRMPNVIDMGQCRATASLLCDAATRPWPRYGLMLYQDGAGNASWQALVAKYERRMDGGLNVRFEYTLGKALSDAWQSANASANQIATCRECSRGPANFDVRHRAVASAVWDLPFRRGHTASLWRQFAIDGWTVTAIAVFSTGQPVNLRAPNQTGSPFITPLPNRICDGRSDHLSDHVRDNGSLWFDTACFAVPAVGYFGNSGPTVLPGPGVHNWDLGVQKSFALPDDAARLQFRAEMFNAWNQAQFQQPNGDAGAGTNFGRIFASRPPRLVQLALKLLW